MNSTLQFATNENIARYYPISQRWCIKRCLPMIVTVVVLASLYLSLNSGVLTLPNAVPLSGTLGVLMLLIQTSAIILVAQMLYCVFFLRKFKYGIKDGSLVISRGVILRETGSFPLSRIIDICVDHDFLDLVFGIRRVHISTPSLESGKFATIDGLTYGSAIDLRTELQEISRANRMLESGNAYGLNEILGEPPETQDAQVGLLN